MKVMTYKDIYEHCKREIKRTKPFIANATMRLRFEEHKMVKDLIERTEAREKCNYIDSGTIGIEDGWYKPECLEKHEKDDFFPWLAMRHFKYCPYCGKEIEVIDE